jgi:peptidoglycan/LPS O-acetylase OafA/YrhL
LKDTKLTSEQNQAVTNSISWGHALYLSTAAQSKENNFRIIRHLAAAIVIYSHAFIVNEGMAAASAREPFKAMFGISIGEIAVDVFFVVSGFLVTHSLMSRGSLADFFLSRTLRIYPALIVLALLSAFVLGPLTTDLPLSQYFSSKAVYGFAILDSLMLTPIHIRFSLPGVFANLPYPDVVNASLWTLPWELWMYWVLAALFATGLLRRPLLWAVPIYTAYILAEFNLLNVSALALISVRFLAFFYAGALLSIYRDRISLSPVILIAATLSFCIGTWWSHNAFLLPPLTAYGVIFFAYHPSLVVRKFSHGADLSYGIYILAYPVQQLLVWAFGPHDPYLHTFVALALTITPAYFSWTFIESPCIELKKRFRSKMIAKDSTAH